VLQPPLNTQIPAPTSRAHSRCGARSRGYTRKVLLPPSGRGLGPCEAVVATQSNQKFLRCLKCNCVAPVILRVLTKGD
jgi:hypothetical protein